ncbi:malonate decarboxylase holo-[acyl-carrier-protein] synthase [Acetobacter sp. TBRC 12305]|uniref:Malonate decarboxylase holo-[acyl-carrier-protein] synthase n=1 Tax=Acetobacter garciniae TaxID=2817435 RepID=A0A939KRM2_9PROT|nr:malonate decarboxylase holo-[acyl-carrier-protein] synthase [Acetobacter garciniae]MBO1325421.1 malonate decarboxylase holo-[acyl-carrier-protein] synthase [Acetobacter garciniae]MBX0345407.1 malonate decarboxylase holo-[acyl-carrier-protein] synthase [Acetobacter garciniae]
MLPIWRHRLLVVRQDVWREVCDATLLELDDDRARSVVQNWAMHGWPLICRRPCERERMEIEAGGVAVGLPLPPYMGKQRLSFILPPSGLESFSGPVWLGDDISFPGQTSARLHDIGQLTALGARHDLAPEAAGSFLWEAVTGMPYLSETSDFDVIWRLPSASMWDVDALSAFLDDLVRTARKLSIRMDGEIVFPGDRAVQWQELCSAQPDDEVLVKTIGSVSLVPVRNLTKARGKVTA